MLRNFYSTDHAPYYIFALDYIQQSAGIRALHYLCHALNESGLEAYVTCEESGTVPHLRTPALTPEIMARHHVTGRKPIMVYPEIVSGDPLAAGGIVVRWLLNKPGLIGGDTSFPEDNLIFTHDQNYLPFGWNCETLHIPTCDMSIFNNENNEHDDKRDLVCFYAHKYLSHGGQLTDHIKDAVSLCKDQILTHAEIAAILRRSKILYIYEPTSLLSEALLCGCPVSIITTDYWRSTMANGSYVADWGVAMNSSSESLALAKTNVHRYRTFYENVILKNAWIQLDRFVELTQATAKLRHISNSAVSK
ncbi:MAG: hypothetical protein Q8O37_02780 [Sulfuricellaceae bacterium]|nr:hypothetical protein [Sulfuricellaceae bacterium]